MIKKKRLIVVDDEPTFCNYVADCADLLGYEVTKLVDPRDFEKLLEGINPDAVVVDMVMPHRDGFDLLEALTASDRKLKVILVTGYLPAYVNSASARLEALGFSDVWTLIKPFPLDALSRALAPAETKAEAERC